MTQDKIRSVVYWVFHIGVMAIPLSQFLSVRILLVAAGMSLFAGWKVRNVFNRSWEMLLFVFVLAVGLAYSTDIDTGLRSIETTLSLMVMPIILGSFVLTRSQVRSLIFSFSAGLLVACAICILTALLRYDTLGVAAFFSDEFTAVIGSHPTYLAYFIIFSITAGLYMIYYETTNISRALLGTVVVFLFVVLILTGGRTAFTSLLLTFSFFVLKFILEPRTKQRIAGFALVCVMITAIFVVHAQEVWTDQELPSGDYWERGVLWESAIRANTDPLIGVGTGDVIDVLNEYYRDHQLASFAEGNYNAHNQFIQVYLSNGVLGLLVLVFLLGRPIYLAMRYENTLALLALFPFVIYGVTEVFFGRYQGVIFFSFLHQAFAADTDYSKRTITTPELG